MAFRIAFFKGTHPGLPGVYSYLVKKRGRGPYSHVELIFSDGLAASSSFLDGGVRFKSVDFTTGEWDILELPKELEAAALAWFKAHEGWGYDIMGNVFLALGFFQEDKQKVFCSEAVGGALGIQEAWRLEPNSLNIVVKRMLDIYKLTEGEYA